MKQIVLVVFVLSLAACGGGGGGGSSEQDPEVMPADTGAEVAPADTARLPDTVPDDAEAPDTIQPEDTIQPFDTLPAGSCGFDYAFTTWTPSDVPPDSLPDDWRKPGPDTDGVAVAHPEPEPPGYEEIDLGDRGRLVMPQYGDNMPAFDRGLEWKTERRCYETPRGAEMLTESEAWSLYRAIAEAATDAPMVTTPGVRSVVGLRGAYPGTFEWNGNAPNRFNDTIVLLWRDEGGDRHVREFPVNTDTGPHDFGWHASSSLRPNRVYPMSCAWHKDYNALKNQDWNYAVRDDTNKNAHWDSDRNGWLPPAGEDHDRLGGAHNIHVASVNGPLFMAGVENWSAGCQTLPGMANWTEFITTAWTTADAPVQYFLVDVRDIPAAVWNPCEPDGSHACPFEIDELPFEADGDTATMGEAVHDLYNCAVTTPETGNEVVYVLHLHDWALLHVAVDDVSGDDVDPDVHLLEGDDPNACVARDNIELTAEVPPGRWVIIVDSWGAAGEAHPGPYHLSVWEE